MSLSMYQASIPVFVRLLGNLNTIIDKAAAHAEAKKIDQSVFINARLAPDMFAFARQIQIATDAAKGAAARLAGVEIPSYADTEATFDELKARISNTIEFVKSLSPAQIDGSEDKIITLKMRGEERQFPGQPYLLYYALPNFYFHITTAYDILRHNGVEIGKRDFLGSFEV